MIAVILCFCAFLLMVGKILLSEYREMQAHCKRMQQLHDLLLYVDLKTNYLVMHGYVRPMFIDKSSVDKWVIEIKQLNHGKR